ILYQDEDFVARVKDITKGALCEVVYDGVGKATFPASLDCIKPLGTFVSFGSSSGQIDAFNINILQQKGSLFATRPTLNTYNAKRDALVKSSGDLFKMVTSGAVKIPVNQKYALKDAQKAHRDLEGRKTTGESVLIPGRMQDGLSETLNPSGGLRPRARRYAGSGSDLASAPRATGSSKTTRSYCFAAPGGRSKASISAIRG